MGMIDAEGLGDAEKHDAGIVDQDIYFSFCGNDAADGLLNRSIVGYVHIYHGDMGRMAF